MNKSSIAHSGVRVAKDQFSRGVIEQLGRILSANFKRNSLTLLPF
jgi:hypothetical protein